MKSRSTGCFFAAILFLGLVFNGGLAAAYKGPDLETLPESAQKVIREMAKESKLARIEEAIENGEMIYTVEVKKAGKTRSFVVCEHGNALRADVFLEETPAAVSAGIRKELGNGALAQIERVPDEEGTIYQVEMTKDGKDRSFSIDEKGALASIEVFLDEIPGAVRKAIQARVGSGRLGDIFKVMEEGKSAYTVNMTRQRKDLSFGVDAEGQLVWSAVLLEETPAAVRKTIRAEVGDGYLDQVVMTVDEEGTVYEVTFSEGEDSETFEVSADGKLLPSEEGGDTQKTSI